ncbi:MAG: cell division protein DedD [Candidatus Komeilibacteria bacterium CG_4_10_14_0_2_um_filter_37_10]|uniref:Cell division protein DedD n=1 Tax=Candidatus Komeilibacteria bacterium CG_4_10_14_0_2_um_filter_37_10 TaxID=1974470 RepID=A0A2M7VE62_9BACT|nr:MAG: cell division protein DedD [Candidatus Komeilibacteria bacterium CG_4_10_14_0_2_um_filter_37_10]PJA92458.1 MAG: cell division protein DedD [Candidatus Komeilibacteria bacterium CG_4_9_14_3_um_filter_37_5]
MDQGEKYQRPGWDEYFIKIMEVVGLRGTCNRGRAGCVIVKNNHILTTGYVGAPPKFSDCDEVGHLMIKATSEMDYDGELHDHCVRTIHAEQNAIVQAARLGLAIEGATAYVKFEPCPVCARMLIAAGIVRVVCQRRYQTGEYTRQMLKEAGVQLDVLIDEVQQYE